MTKRILFVDDDPVLLQLHILMLENNDQDWEVEGVEGPVQALERMAVAPFDVIVSDFEMPHMSGVALLAEVMKRHPSVARVIVSGLTDQQRIAQSLCETHQFIAKPLAPSVLKSTLVRICGLDRYLRDERLRALVTRLGAVPSFPSTYIEIMQELTAREPSVEKIAEFSAKDPGMTAKLLQIANSAAMGLGQKVTSPQEAVQYVGMGTVRSLALAAHVLERFEREPEHGFSIAALWEHALRSATLARAILRQARAETAEVDDGYIAAMLHDIGKLLLAYNEPKEYRKAVNLATARSLPLWQAEREVFGADHAAVGAYLLGLWGLPAVIVEAVALHHTPLESEARVFGPLAAVHVASALEHECSEGAASPSAVIHEDYLRALGVQDELPAWRATAGKLLKPQAD